MPIDNDLATDLVGNSYGGDGGLEQTLSNQLTGETPPVVPVRPSAESAPAPTVPTAPDPRPVTAEVPVALPGGFFSKITSAVASAQGKIPLGGLRSAPLQAASKLGASSETAGNIAVWFWPVVVVVGGVSVVVYLLRRRLFSHHVTA